MAASTRADGRVDGSCRPLSALRTAAAGRQPGLKLERGGREVALADWGAELLEACAPIAQRVDAALGGDAYRDALRVAQTALQRTDTLPSARVLDAMRRQHDSSYTRFVRTQSEATRAHLLELPFAESMREHFSAEARASLAAQRLLEAAEQPPFETFRQAYLAPERLGL